MKKAAQNILKRRAKAVSRKAKNKKSPLQVRNILIENTRKLLSGDINFFNKLKERNSRRRLAAPI